MKSRKTVAESNRWVIKIGSSLITNDGRGLNTTAIQSWAQQISDLRAAGKEVVLVSSGAVAEGMARIGWKKRPQRITRITGRCCSWSNGIDSTVRKLF